jgi:hypothetical protein
LLSACKLCDGRAAETKFAPEILGSRTADGDLVVAAGAVMQTAAGRAAYFVQSLFATFLLDMTDAGKRLLRLDGEAVWQLWIIGEIEPWQMYHRPRRSRANGPIEAFSTIRR